jgi:hypothetical protein
MIVIAAEGEMSTSALYSIDAEQLKITPNSIPLPRIHIAKSSAAFTFRNVTIKSPNPFPARDSDVRMITPSNSASFLPFLQQIPASYFQT